jgi:hypothetical protein
VAKGRVVKRIKIEESRTEKEQNYDSDLGSCAQTSLDPSLLEYLNIKFALENIALSHRACPGGFDVC